MAVTQDSLNAFAKSVRIVKDVQTPVEPGQVTKLALAPDPTQGMTDFLSAPLNGVFILKDVRFSTKDLEPSLAAGDLNQQILGGMPISGGPALQGIPGALGQYAASVSIPRTVPVSAEIKWSVLDEDHALMEEGFIAPTALALSIGLVFLPPIVDFTLANVPTLSRYVTAQIRLTAEGLQSDWTDVPEVEIDLVALMIPTVGALFRHGNFLPYYEGDDGFAFLVAPADSPLTDLASLLDELPALQVHTANLSGFSQFAAFALGLSELSDALASHANQKRVLAIAPEDTIGDLSTYKDELGTNPENQISSMIFIGRSGWQLNCYNKGYRKTGHGKFHLTTGGEMFVLVRHLGVKTPVAEPPGDIIVDVKSTEGETFGDTISSILFISP
jgi:hypothetical protein